MRGEVVGQEVRLAWCRCLSRLASTTTVRMLPFLWLLLTLMWGRLLLLMMRRLLLLGLLLVVTKEPLMREPIVAPVIHPALTFLTRSESLHSTSTAIGTSILRPIRLC
jgi:hypothetical protein